MQDSQTQRKNDIFRYGPRHLSPINQCLSTRSIQMVENDSKSQLVDLINDSQCCKLELQEQKLYIQKLLSIINRQKKEIDESKELIRHMELDLKNHKQFNQKLQDTIRYMSESSDNIKQSFIIDEQTKSNVLLAQKSIIQSSLCENFMIISVDKQHVYEQMKNRTDKIFMSEPTIIYQYPKDNKSWEICYKAILPKIVYPFGVETKILRKSVSMSNLNEILYGGLSPDKFENVSVLTFKSDESFLQQSKIVEEERDLLKLSNPNNLLFCICLEQKDFFNEEQQQDQRSRKFISVSKTYLFMTKVPLIPFFVDLLHIIVSDLKLRKASLHATMDQNLDIDLIDYEFHYKYSKELESVLSSLLQKTIKPQFEFIAFDQKIVLNIQNQQDLTYMDCDWGAYVILNVLSLDQFIIILSSLLCEQHVVIVSQQKNILSSAMLLFHSLLKPFKWPHPFISTISTDMLQILDSPIPVFVGILKDERFIIMESLFDQFGEILFIELDGSFIDSSLEVNIFTQSLRNIASQSLIHLKKLLTPYFAKLQIKDNNNRIQHRYIIPTPDDFEIRTYHDIFKQVSIFFDEVILRHLPIQPTLVQQTGSTCLDYLKIGDQIRQNNLDDRFIEDFLRTQIFVYYLEEKYT